MATWFVREELKYPFGQRGARNWLFSLLVTEVPEAVNRRELTELLRATGKAYEPVEVLSGFLVWELLKLQDEPCPSFLDTSGSRRVLSQSAKTELREMVGTERHVSYAALMDRLREPVFGESEEPQAPLHDLASRAERQASMPPQQRVLDGAYMKQLFQDYSPETAQGLLKSIPKAWRSHVEKGGRWGPGVIAEAANLNRGTVSRYLKALYEAGLTSFDCDGESIENPYRPKQHT